MVRNVRQYLAFAQEFHDNAKAAASRGDAHSAVEQDCQAQREHRDARESADLVDLFTLDRQTRWSR
jgi:hypothetical protein